MSTIKIFFNWGILRPDKREYKQQSVELFPISLEGKSMRVAVDIEFTAANIDNFDLISKHREQANIGTLYAETQKTPEPDAVLTAAGMVAAMAVFEKLLRDMLEPDDFGKPNTEADNWGEAIESLGTTEAKTAAPEKVADEDWGGELSEEGAPWEDDWSDP